MTGLAGKIGWRDPCDGLPLRVATAPEWLQVAISDLDSLLVDHAWCEHKAASTPLSLVARFPGQPQLIRPLLSVAQEEMQHFRQVVDRLEARGRTLPPPRPDRYVGEIRRRFCSEGKGIGGLGDLLLVSAFIEARSCERFRILADGLVGTADETLGDFYRRLAQAEGRHWELFRDLALTVLPEERVRRRIEDLAEIEGEIAAALEPEPRMH